MVTIFLGGDVMTGRGVDQILAHPSEPELRERYISDAWDYVALAEREHGPIPRPAPPEWIWGVALEELERRRVDVRIVNLETSITRSGEFWEGKEIQYRMKPDNIPCLTVAKLDACVLGNNHVMDFGRSGLVETLDTLQRAGVRSAGAGLNLEEARRPCIIDLEFGSRIVMVAVATPSSGVPEEWAATPERPGIALLTELSEAAAKDVAAQLTAVRQPGDVSIVSIHWGSNWGYDVPAEHVKFAHLLIDQGVNVVYGHSSHHPRPIEVYQGGVILYGCGDLIDDYEGISGHESYRGDLRVLYLVSLDPGSGKVVEVRMAPLQARKMRLERGSDSDAGWLVDVLNRTGRRFGSRVVLASDGTLLLKCPA